MSTWTTIRTPPGYDAASVIRCCISGGSGDLPSNWVYDGRANFMMDNLLAEGKAVPMVIAIPNNRCSIGITRGTLN
jgi:hypothetical protein